MSDSAPAETGRAPAGRWMRLGLIILGISLIFWALLPIIPFLPLSARSRAILGGIDFVLAEVSFWGGALLAGKEVVRKYQDRLNPFKRRSRS